MKSLECLTMEISERIKQRMKARGLKAVNIAAHTKASKGSVSQWVNGISKPSVEYLVKLCEILECTEEWLLFGKDYKSSAKSVKVIGFISEWDKDTVLDPDEVELPFYPSVAFSAGNGSCDFDEYDVQKLRFNKSTLKSKGVDPNCAICLTVQGNSMTPMLPDGSTIGIDRSKNKVEDGKIFAIDHSGMMRVKLLYNAPGGGLRLRSFNSDEYPDEIYSAADSVSVVILGKVFWSSVLY